jgi:hypothetical protein
MYDGSAPGLAQRNEEGEQGPYAQLTVRTVYCTMPLPMHTCPRQYTGQRRLNIAAGTQSGPMSTSPDDNQPRDALLAVAARDITSPSSSGPLVDRHGTHECSSQPRPSLFCAVETPAQAQLAHGKSCATRTRAPTGLVASPPHRQLNHNAAHARAPTRSPSTPTGMGGTPAVCVSWALALEPVREP